MHRFLLRLFLRDAKINSVYIIAPYISPMFGATVYTEGLTGKGREGLRFSLRHYQGTRRALSTRGHGDSEG